MSYTIVRMNFNKYALSYQTKIYELKICKVNLPRNNINTKNSKQEVSM